MSTVVQYLSRFGDIFKNPSIWALEPVILGLPLAEKLHHVRMGDDHIRVALQRVKVMAWKIFAGF